MHCRSCGAPTPAGAALCPSCGAVPDAGPPTLFGRETRTPGPRYAGFWIRVGAALVDGVLVEIAAVIVGFALGAVVGIGAALTHSLGPGMHTVSVIIGGGAGLAVGVVWYPWMEASAWQATVGKRLFGLKVTDEQGRRIGFGRAMGRYLGKILSGLTLGIGYMMVGWTARKQGLHDKLAGTLVVRT